MKYWMYAGGDITLAQLKALRRAGLTGVMGPAGIAAQALEQGLEVMACGGAFPASGTPGEEHLAVDIRGNRRVWFHSCCPNHQPTRQKNLEDYRKMAKTPGISGVMIDGARFSSPASSLELDSFFTCFCPRCMEKMDRLGLDGERIRSGVSGLYCWLREGGTRPSEWEGVRQWLKFRELCAGEHLRDFAEAVGQTPEVKTGAFFFAPSLAGLVGQSYRDMAGVLDLISPMLYPAYAGLPGDPGTACLNWELDALARLLTERGAMAEEEAHAFLQKKMGRPLPDLDQLSREVPRQLIAEETALARKEGRPAQIVPILQLDDPKLTESLRQVQAGGGEEVAFFAYAPGREKLLQGLV